MDGQKWLDDIRKMYRQYKANCEEAADHVTVDQYFEKVADIPHSLAILMKHVGGNMRSRWRDFLTTDGEKRDRNRESEFDVSEDTRATVMAKWEDGWEIALKELDSLSPDDLDREITIRGEPHTVAQAINRNLNHVSYHAGQIVILARHFAGDKWKWQSIPPGKSEESIARYQEKYGNWWKKEDGQSPD